MRRSVFFILVAIAGCREKRADEAVSTTSVTNAELPRIATVGGSGERVVVLAGDPQSRRPIVFLHDACIDPKLAVDTWGVAVRNEGTLLAVDGDAPCPDGSSTWSEDAVAIDRRIQDALAIDPRLDPRSVVLVGAGLGAARVELLAKERPDRYQRFVLVGGAAAPSVTTFRRARAVATVAGDDEPLVPMQDGSRVLDRAGISSHHWTIPHATHGEYGTEGPRMMRDAIDFVTAR